MDEALHVGIGTVATVAVGSLLWRGSAGVASRIRGLSPLDRLSATIAVAVLVALLATTALAAAGQLSGVAVGLLIAAVSVAMIAATRGAPWWPGPSAARLREVAAAEPFLVAVAVAGAAPVLLALAYALPRPPLEYDPLNYHLVLASHHLKAGDLSIFRFPPWLDPYAYMPAGTDLVESLAMAPFSCDLLVPLANLPFLALLLLSAYSLCRDGGASRTVAAAASVALALMPLAFRVLTEAYAELPLWGTFLAAVRWMALSARAGGMPSFALAAGLCGLVTGMKLNGVALAVVALAFHFLSPGAQGGLAAVRRLPSRLAVFVAAVAVAGSAFFVRNAVATGNPFYPAPVDLPGLGTLPGLDGLGDRMAATTIWSRLDFLWESGRLSRAFVGETGTAESSWGTGPTGVLALVLGLFALAWSPWRRERRAQVLLPALAGAALLVLYAMLPRSGSFLMTNVRFAVPGMLLLGIAGTVAASRAGVPAVVLASAFLAAQGASVAFSCLVVTPGAGLLLGAAGAAVAVLSLGGSKAEWGAATPAWRKALVAAGGVAVLCAAATFLHHGREARRIASWREATAPHQQVVPGHVDCLEALERAVPGGRVAVAADRGAASFLYPLLGSHQQRDLVYLDVGRSDAPLPHEHPRGDPRGAPDEAAWIARVAATRPDALFAYLAGGDPPVEAVWAARRPEAFEPLVANAACGVWRVRPDHLP
jgi:hypothetical protein